MNSGDFSTRVLTVSVFPRWRNEQNFSVGAVVACLYSHFQDRYDGAVLTPQSVKVEASNLLKIDTTSVSLKSRDEELAFLATPERFDSVWMFKLHSERHLQRKTTSEIANYCLRPIIKLLSVEKLQVGRLALSMLRRMPIAAPQSKLIECFCRPELSDVASDHSPFRNSRDFQIHNLKTYVVPGETYDVNSWVRCYSGIDGNAPVICLDHDMNTLQEKAAEAQFNQDGIIKFFDTVSKDADKIVSLYFPKV